MKISIFKNAGRKYSTLRLALNNKEFKHLTRKHVTKTKKMFVKVIPYDTDKIRLVAHNNPEDGCRLFEAVSTPGQFEARPDIVNLPITSKKTSMKLLMTRLAETTYNGKPFYCLEFDLPASFRRDADEGELETEVSTIPVKKSKPAKPIAVPAPPRNPREELKAAIRSVNSLVNDPELGGTVVLSVENNTLRATMYVTVEQEV